VIRVGVLGAAGRMGRMVCRAVAGDPELSLVAGISPGHAGRPLGELAERPELAVEVSGDIETLTAVAAEVAVDFTTPSTVMEHIRWGIRNGVHMVVGTTGIRPKDLQEIGELTGSEDGRSNVVVAPNFALGAVLMQRFAVQAARVFPAAEIIELHHDGKADAPSGTALTTAERMAGARTDAWEGPANESLGGVRGGSGHGIRIHSIRLPGLVAHQVVIFGGTGETLTIRHDSSSRDAFIPGVLLAIKSVGARPGLTVGMEPLLRLDAEG
jgi:4-hydroxy-tetrahydrodipicolinate reductase